MAAGWGGGAPPGPAPAGLKCLSVGRGGKGAHQQVADTIKQQVDPLPK
jgi:hypothetical protein